MTTGQTIAVVLAVLTGLAVIVLILKPSRRRFIWNLLRQVPYLIPRYFV